MLSVHDRFRRSFLLYESTHELFLSFNMTRSARRGPWMANEDQALLELVKSQGANNWVRISQHIPGRSPKQCRERYHQNLKPNLNHGPITASEGEEIEKMVREMGNRWAEIARRLGNRSDNAIKNWWNGSVNRRKRHNMTESRSKTGVGSRPQPIPATRRTRSYSTRQDDLRVVTAPETSLAWDHSQGRTRTMSHGMSVMDSSHSTCTPRPHTGYVSMKVRPSLYSDGSMGSRQSQRPRRHWDSEPPTLPTPANLYGHPAHPPLHSPRDLPSPFPRADLAPYGLSSLPATVEPPMISPAGSEWSRPPSLKQAPSLVSDDLSTHSVSPKTVQSPRPDLRSLVDTNAQTWPEDPSAPRTNGPRVHTKAFQHDTTQTDERFVASLPRSASVETKSHLPYDVELKRHGSYQNNLGPRLPSSYLPPKSEPPSPAGPSPNTARDVRMHVASILH